MSKTLVKRTVVFTAALLLVFLLSMSFTADNARADVGGRGTQSVSEPPVPIETFLFVGTIGLILSGAAGLILVVINRKNRNLAQKPSDDDSDTSK